MLSRLAVAARAAKIAAPEVRNALGARLWQQPLPVDVTLRSDISSEAAAADAGPSRVHELHTDQEVHSVMRDAAQSNTLSVFDFTATWCGPCKMIAPVYEQLSRDHEVVNFYKIDIDRPEVHESVAAAGVASVPTFQFFRGSRKIATFSGADKRQLENQVVNLMAMGA